MTIQTASEAIEPLEPLARWPEGSAKRLIHAFTTVFVQVVLNSVCFFLIGPAMLPPDGPTFEGRPMEFAFVGIVAFFGFLNVDVVICRLGRMSLRRLGWILNDISGDFAWGAFGLALCALVMGGGAWLQGGSAGVNEFIQSVASQSLRARLLFLTIGASAAAYEESIFRGYLQPTLTRRIGVWPGVALTAATFSIYHLRMNPMGLAAKFALGLVFGALREKRRSLVAPATAHALVWIVMGGA